MWQLIQDNFISNYHEYLGDLHHMLVALSKIQTFVFSRTPLILTSLYLTLNISIVLQSNTRYLHILNIYIPVKPLSFSNLNSNPQQHRFFRSV